MIEVGKRLGAYLEVPSREMVGMIYNTHFDNELTNKERLEYGRKN